MVDEFGVAANASAGATRSGNQNYLKHDIKVLGNALNVANKIADPTVTGV